MPRISAWNPNKSNDYKFIDRISGELMKIAGDGILVHKYEGPTTDANGNTNTDITTIQDVVFLTNVNRKYDPNVIELRGHHTIQDVNYDLTQFGIFLSSDQIRVQFHYNDMVDSLGRRLISGDVLEFPALRDVPISNNGIGINRYYVIQDSLYAANGYGPKWYPHLWLVRAKLLTASPEFTEILNQAADGQNDGGIGQGIGVMPPGFTNNADSNGNPTTGNTNISSTLNLFCKLIGLTDDVIKEAEKNAYFDPKFFESANLYIYIDPATGYPQLGKGSNYFSGDGAPPNGLPLKGAGASFPDNLIDGDFFLRLDYYPERLFQKQGNTFKLIEVNILKNWTATNRVLDTFIDNINDTNLPDGTVIPEKQAVSKVLKQKVDLYADRKQQIAKDECKRSSIADKRETKG